MTDDAKPEKPEYEENETVPDFDANPDSWQRENVTFQRILRLRLRTVDVIHGREKALIGYGPPGVGKTWGVMLDLREYAVNKKRAWEQMELDDPYRERFTRIVEGMEEFRIPFIRCHGRISPIRLYARFCQYKSAGQVVVCDDVRALLDKQAQNLIQDGTDPEGDYKIGWETDRGEVRAAIEGSLHVFPTEEQFLAGLIILNNFAPSSAKANLIFEQAMRDRCVEVELTWKRPDIGIYIDRMAFTRYKDRGLWKYLIGRTFGPPHARGLGFDGTDGQAIDILQDVRRYFHAHFADIEVVGFRFLEKVCRDRVHHPKDWQDMAFDHLTGF